MLPRRLFPVALAWLHDWADRAHNIATGFFEIGSLLALDGLWQTLDKVRVLMGDETTRRTRRAIVESLRQISERSIEDEKERDDSLMGLPAIREALTSGKLLVRAFSKAKFHAKTYIFNMRPPQLSNYALVGSSNFTRPGLTENVELNLLTSDALQVKALAEWFEQHWREGDSVRDELVVVLDRHLREWQPFEIWAKALLEYFAGKERPPSVWEETESVMYRALSQYQKDGYHQALRIADDWAAVEVGNLTAQHAGSLATWHRVCARCQRATAAPFRYRGKCSGLSARTSQSGRGQPNALPRELRHIGERIQAQGLVSS